MRNSAIAFLIIGLFIVAAVPAQDGETEPAANAFSFTEISKEAGVRGFNPNAGGHGVVFGDVNNDGFVDFYITNALSVPVNVPNYLFMNNGNGTFRQEGAGRGVRDNDVDRPEFLGSHGAVFADLNRDGSFDLYLGNAGFDEPGLSRVFMNNGGGYFEDKTESAGLFDKRFDSRGVAVADLNGDGILDLVQTNTYPADYRGAPGQLPQAFPTERVFWGQEDGTYEADDSTGMLEYGFSQGIIAVDIDGDGDQDIIESGWPEKKFDDRSNLLWLNDGNGHFVDASEKVSATFAREPDGKRSNGAVAADMDNDGDLDIITVGDRLHYYRNDGNMNFTDLTDTCGMFIELESFTVIVGDVDHDGDLDAFIPDQAEEFRFFENFGNNRFEERKRTGIKSKRFNDQVPDPRGAALADIDNDGDLDLVIANKYNYIQIFRNDLKSRNFFRFDLIGVNGDRGAIGTQIYVYPEGMINQKSTLLVFREAMGSTGYLAQNDPTMHIGLPRGSDKRYDVLIKFPSGERVKMLNVRRGKTYLIDGSQIKNVNRDKPVITLLSDTDPEDE